MSDIAELAAAWPDMPDLEGGVDRFAEYPVAAEPVDAPAPGIAGLVDDYADVFQIITTDYELTLLMGDHGGRE